MLRHIVIFWDAARNYNPNSNPTLNYQYWDEELQKHLDTHNRFSTCRNTIIKPVNMLFYSTDQYLLYDKFHEHITSLLECIQATYPPNYPLSKIDLSSHPEFFI